MSRRINLIYLADIVRLNAQAFYQRPVAPRVNERVMNAACLVELRVNGFTTGWPRPGQPTLREQLDSLRERGVQIGRR